MAGDIVTEQPEDARTAQPRIEVGASSAASSTVSWSSAVTCRRGNTTSHPGSDVPNAWATRHRPPAYTRSRGGESASALLAQLRHSMSAATACIIAAAAEQDH
jgi:hypothetical protein